MKFVLIEGGVSWLPPLLWRFDKNWRALRQTTPWLERPPSEIIRDYILLTTQPLEEPELARHFHRILEMFDAERMLMFSSDFPHWDGDTPDFCAHTFPLALRSRIMQGQRANCIAFRRLFMPESTLPVSTRHEVARASEIAPGARKIVEVAGRSIGIFNLSDELVAVLNICPHELAPVCKGRVSGTTLPSQPGEYRWGREGEILVCPWHGWEFDLRTGRALAHDRKHLRRYSVTVENDTLFICLGSSLPDADVTQVVSET